MCTTTRSVFACLHKMARSSWRAEATQKVRFGDTDGGCERGVKPELLSLASEHKWTNSVSRSAQFNSRNGTFASESHVIKFELASLHRKWKICTSLTQPGLQTLSNFAARCSGLGKLDWKETVTCLCSRVVEEQIQQWQPVQFFIFCLVAPMFDLK